MLDRSIALAYAGTHHSEFLSDLSDLLRIPSISTFPEHQADMHAAANLVAAILRDSGCEDVRILPTPGHPVVFGANLKAGPSLPTVLIYAHYDVQPADPLDLWETPPFDPVERGDLLIARGASDMKGQFIAAIAAIRSILSHESCPVNVKFLVEGEEEIGSPNLRPFLEANRELLACDFALNPDAGMIAADIPTIVYSLRGLSYFELRLYGPSHDLHSGVFGGTVHNPAQALCELIAKMHDSNGTVTLPGFYDRVRRLTDAERAELARLPMDETYYLDQTGVPALWGEKEFSPSERVGARPTLEINGLYSGFIAKGAKTVIPAYAMAKISMRLVADQDPEEVHTQLRTFIEANLPPTLRYELDFFGGAPACATDPNHPATQALARALETVWQSRPMFKREGGSVPVVGDMQRILGADSTLTGFGLPDDRIHSPNEHLHLPTWYRGVDALIHFFYNLVEKPSGD